jgi:IS30 family transposase
MRSSRKKITDEEFSEILKLSDEGMVSKDIAKKTGRARSSIDHMILHRNTYKVVKKKIYKPIVLVEREEVDLSSLPDNVLFEHSKEYAF